MSRRLLFLLAALGVGAVIVMAAPAAASAWVLTVNTAGNASGEVLSAGFDCDWDGITKSGECTETYPAAAAVGLVAYPAGAAVTIVWQGCSSVVGNQCLIATRSTDLTVTVTFSRGFQLSVTKAGTGGGTVSSAPAGINCGATCVAIYANATSVTLTATDAAGSIFAGWTGACTGTGTCIVAMTAARAVIATFNLAPTQYVLSVTVQGQGSVSSSPAGIACGSDCSESYTAATQVVLSASPAAGFDLVGFDGCDTTSGATCTVAMSAARNVTATFRDNEADATLRSAAVSTRPDGKRVITIEIQADERVRVSIRLERGFRLLAAKNVSGVGAGFRTFVLVIPEGVTRGRARLEVTFRDEAGNVEADTRSVRVPA
jgi:hypothetical protein